MILKKINILIFIFLPFLLFSQSNEKVDIGLELICHKGQMKADSGKTMFLIKISNLSDSVFSMPYFFDFGIDCYSCNNKTDLSIQILKLVKDSSFAELTNLPDIDNFLTSEQKITLVPNDNRIIDFYLSHLFYLDGAGIYKVRFILDTFRFSMNFGVFKTDWLYLKYE